jgi:hypothetical protein
MLLVSLFCVGNQLAIGNEDALDKNIVCNSQFCNVSTSDDREQIEKMIDDYLVNDVNNAEDINTKIIAILNPDQQRIEELITQKHHSKNFSNLKKLIENDEVVSLVVNSEKIKFNGFDRLKADGRKKIQMENSQSEMTFRYLPFNEEKSYLAASVYMEKILLRENEYRVKMNTLNYGKAIRNGWIVDIGIIKQLDSASMKKFNPSPDGILLRFKRVL